MKAKEESAATCLFHWGGSSQVVEVPGSVTPGFPPLTSDIPTLEVAEHQLLGASNRFLETPHTDHLPSVSKIFSFAHKR